MKAKLFLTIFFIAILLRMASAQFALEKIYDHSLTSTRINEAEYKYYLMDVTKSECRIYNLDHTLYKTISISLPNDYYLQDIRFVTQNLFNTDSSIELWYSAYNWVPVGNDGYYRYISKVINDKGNVLAYIDGGLYAYIIKSADDQFKLSVYAYDNSFWPGSVKTYIFNLPSTQTAAFYAMVRLNDPYPNPATDALNIPVPAGEVTGKIQVFSNTGQLVSESSLSGQSLFRLNTTGWAPGTYTYRIVSHNSISESKKFVVH